MQFCKMPFGFSLHQGLYRVETEEMDEDNKEITKVIVLLLAHYKHLVHSHQVRYLGVSRLLAYTIQPRVLQHSTSKYVYKCLRLAFILPED